VILSHAHRFIFMHSRKTAGSSVTALLNPHLGPRDLQVGAWPESIEAGGRYNRRTLGVVLRSPVKLMSKSLEASRGTGGFRLAPGTVNGITKRHYRKRGLPLMAHSTAAQMRAFCPDAWARYFKFAIVRNPWTHAVSDYHWRLHMRRDPEVSFREYLMRLDDPDRPDPEDLRPPILSNWEIYTIDDEIALDFVGRYETLQADLEEAGRRIGIPIDISRVRAKGAVRRSRPSVAEHYDAELVEIVRRLYRREVEAFGYAPPF
jgi:hypothetical protein